MKKKNILIIAIIVLLVILLFPFKINRLRDGGTVEYKALLYKLTDYHKFGTDTEYVEGIKFEILGKEIFNNTTMYHIEKNPETDKKVKLKDLKITAKNVDTTKLVKFDGVLYGKSNALIDYAGDLNKSIGKIDFLIGEEYMPELNGETNCKEIFNASVLEANGKSMVLNVDNVAILFESIDKENIKKLNGEDENTEYTCGEIHSFVGTVLEETTTYMIVEPNEDEKERKSSDKIQINYATDHKDYLYGIGRKVIIQYNGAIKESYPAQINTDYILTDGYENFTLTVKKSENTNKRKILNNTELYKNNSVFNLYYYGLDEVNVTIKGQTMSLEKALKSGRITLDGLIIKANKDFPNATSYDDGGSIEYHYKDYSIIKVHKLDGNRDVYIGVPSMKLNDLKL
jgi:hypothetical protein